MMTTHTLIAGTCAFSLKLSKVTSFEAVLNSNFQVVCFHPSLVDGYNFSFGGCIIMSR